MEKKAEKIHDDRWLTDLPIQLENPAFKSEDMILCGKCARTNPSTRLDCLYCGAALEFTEAQSEIIKPNLRKLEDWEKGFNLVFLNVSDNFDSSKLSEIAKMLKCEEGFLRKLIDAKKTLPLARVESEKEAQIIKKRLNEFGIETLIVSDETLAVEKPLHRLRGIEFSGDKIVLLLFNKDEIVEIAGENLVLIITGAIFERRVEAIEKRVKKGENKILQTNETASDALLMDIYSRDNKIGYRILAQGFDFSCLESEKEIVAVNNLKKLAQKLRQIAPEAKFVDDYLQIREILGMVWQVEERVDSQGLKREGFGKFNLGNLTTVNNSSQFTKYSRLRRQLL